MTSFDGIVRGDHQSLATLSCDEPLGELLRAEVLDGVKRLMHSYRQAFKDAGVPPEPIVTYQVRKVTEVERIGLRKREVTKAARTPDVEVARGWRITHRAYSLEYTTDQHTLCRVVSSFDDDGYGELGDFRNLDGELWVRSFRPGGRDSYAWATLVRSAAENLTRIAALSGVTFRP